MLPYFLRELWFTFIHSICPESGNNFPCIWIEGKQGGWGRAAVFTQNSVYIPVTLDNSIAGRISLYCKYLFKAICLSIASILHEPYWITNQEKVLRSLAKRGNINKNRNILITDVYFNKIIDIITIGNHLGGLLSFIAQFRVVWIWLYCGWSMATKGFNLILPMSS